MKKHHAGRTLVELLIAFSIASFLLIAAIPGWQALRQKAEQYAAQEQIAHAIALARTTAINTGQVITTCPSDDGLDCQQQASKHLLVFNDLNGNKLAEPDELLWHEKPSDYQRSVHFKVSAGRRYIRFRPDGSAIEFGRIVLCSTTAPMTALESFVLNYGGRLRIASGSASCT